MSFCFYNYGSVKQYKLLRVRGGKPRFTLSEVCPTPLDGKIPSLNNMSAKENYTAAEKNANFERGGGGWPALWTQVLNVVQFLSDTSDRSNHHKIASKFGNSTENVKLIG